MEEKIKQKQKINLEEMKEIVMAMDKKTAMKYMLDEAWFRTPRPFQIAILKRAGWNWLELYVASSIENHRRKDNVFYESEESIAELLGMSPGTVRKAASRLKAKGAMMRGGKSGQRSRQWMEKPTNMVTSSPLPSSRQPHPNSHVNPTTFVTSHNNKKKKNKKKKNKKEGKGKGGKPPAFLPVLFNSFSEEERESFLNDISWDSFVLKTPNGLASCWRHLNDKAKELCEATAGVEVYSAARSDPETAHKDFTIAHETLKQIEGCRTSETVRKWLEWYVVARGLGGAGYLTEFSDSWKDFQKHQEELKKAAEAKEAEEELQREAKRKMDALKAIEESPELSMIWKAANEEFEEIGEWAWDEMQDLAEGHIGDDTAKHLTGHDAEEICRAIREEKGGLGDILHKAAQRIYKRNRRAPAK